MKSQVLQVYLNQRVPVKDYPDFEVLADLQCQLVELLQAVSNKYYVRTFLRQFINSNELLGNEIIEEIYELYCDPEIIGAQVPDPSQTDHIIYHIKHRNMEIKETPNIIGGLGTTGLRTWEASLYLASRLETSGNGDFSVQGTVCELGTGTGIVGMSLLPEVDKVIFTDGDSNLLETIPQNLKINQLGNNYDIKQLIWGPESDVVQLDYLVAADVTYDTSVLPDLVNTIKKFLQNGCKKALIAATVRNESTLKEFESILDNSQLQWTILETFTPEKVFEFNGSTIWYRPGTPPIRVYCIRN